MTNNEKIKQTSATLFKNKLFKNKIQEINNTLKDLELGQLQFSLEEKYSRISATFVSSEGDDTVVGSLENIFNKKQEDILAWLSNQFNNRYLYKALHSHFGDYFGAIYIDQPTQFLLKFDDITYFISQDISEEYKAVATVEGVVSRAKEEDLEMQLKDNISVCTFAEERKGLFFDLSKTIQSPFETLWSNMNDLKAELEARAENILNDKKDEGVNSAPISFERIIQEGIKEKEKLAESLKELIDSTSESDYFSVVAEFVKTEKGNEVLFNVDVETANACLDNFNIKLITIYREDEDFLPSKEITVEKLAEKFEQRLNELKEMLHNA